MKLGSCLLAVLALGTLSVDSAQAGHRGHGVHYASSHHQSRAVPRSVETPRTSTVTPRDSSSETNSAVADQSKGSAKDGSRPTGLDKANGDDESLHARKSGKTGVVTPGPGVNGKEGADAAIDTRIPVNQGREKINGLGKRQLRSSSANIATGIGLKRQHVVDRHQGTPMRPPGDLRRNSIGATVDRDKTGERRNALGVAVVPKGTSDLETKSGSAPLATGAVTHDSGAEHPTGKFPTDGSFSGATQGNRRDGTALTIARTNGLSISGTGMIRPGSNAATIGGAPKIAVGVLSGNSFRPKHP